MMRERRRPSHTAFHEAGHAVACVQLGVTIKLATIVPSSDGSAGRVEHAPVPKLADPARSYRTSAIIAFAGPAAQRRSHPRSPIAHGAMHDHAVANLTADVLFDAMSSRRSFLRCAAAEARQLVERHWLAVDHVARALWDRRCLSGFAVASIVADAEDEWTQVAAYQPGRTPFVYARQRALAAQGAPPLRRYHIAEAALRATLAGIEDVAGAVVSDLSSRGFAAETILTEWNRAKEARPS